MSNGSQLTSVLSVSTLLLLACMVPAKADCAAEIKSIVLGMASAGPYHVVSNTKAQGMDSRLEGNVILPDSFDMTMPQGRMVMTGNGVWMQSNGQWQKMPDEMRDQMKSMINQGMAMGGDNIKSPECLGEKDYEGGHFTAYSYDGSATFMGIASKSQVTLYVDEKKRPAWLVVDGEALGTKSVTVQKLTYDASITIADPQ